MVQADSDEGTQFTVVRYRRRNRARNRLRSVAVADDGDGRDVTAEHIERVIISKLDACLSSYCEQVIDSIEAILDGRKLTQIHAIGLGNFHRRYKSGCEQVALLILLKSHFRCFVHFQEPCTLPAEKEWLENHDIFVSKSMDLLSERCSEADEEISLFYAPHCPHAIYNSLIHAHRKGLHRFILFGNSTLWMDETLSLNTLGDATYEQKKVIRKQRLKQKVSSTRNAAMEELRALCCYRRLCQEVKLADFYGNYSAFNDVCLLYVTPEAASSALYAIPDSSPRYRLFADEIILEMSEPP